MKKSPSFSSFFRVIALSCIIQHSGSAMESIPASDPSQNQVASMQTQPAVADAQQTVPPVMPTTPDAQQTAPPPATPVMPSMPTTPDTQQPATAQSPAAPVMPIMPTSPDKQQPAPSPAAPVMPTTPDTQQAPQSIPLPTATQTASAPIQQSAAVPQVPVQQVSSTPVPTPVQSTMPKQDLEQIAKTITSIKTIKSSLQDQLKDIDEKIYEARMLDAQAKKLNFTILDATNDAEANKILSQIQEASKKIELLEEMIKGSMAKAVDDSIAKIQDQMRTLEDLIKKLEAQGVSFQTHELAVLDASTLKTPEKQASPIPQQAITLKTSAPVLETPASKSFLGHLTDICINVIVGVIKAVGNIFSFIKKSIMPTPVLSTEPVHSEAKQEPNIPEEVKKKVPKAGLQEQLNKANEALKHIDQAEKELNEKYHTIEHPLKVIVDSASSNPDVQKKLAEDSENAPLIQYDSTFKKTALEIFGTLTDGFITGVNFVTKKIETVYRDIKSRVQEKKHEKDLEIEQEAPVMPTAPAHR